MKFYHLGDGRIIFRTDDGRAVQFDVSNEHTKDLHHQIKFHIEFYSDVQAATAQKYFERFPDMWKEVDPTATEEELENAIFKGDSRREQ